MTVQQVVDTIDQYIKENNNEEITGVILNSVMKVLLSFSNEKVSGFNGAVGVNSNPSGLTTGYWIAAETGVYTNFNNINIPINNFGIIEFKNEAYKVSLIKIPIQDLTAINSDITQLKNDFTGLDDRLDTQEDKVNVIDDSLNSLTNEFNSLALLDGAIELNQTTKAINGDTAIKYIQNKSVVTFDSNLSSGLGYDLGAKVFYNDKLYQSIKSENKDLPITVVSWKEMKLSGDIDEYFSIKKGKNLTEFTSIKKIGYLTNEFNQQTERSSFITVYNVDISSFSSEETYLNVKLGANSGDGFNQEIPAIIAISPSGVITRIAELSKESVSPYVEGVFTVPLGTKYLAFNYRLSHPVLEGALYSEVKNEPTGYIPDWVNENFSRKDIENDVNFMFQGLNMSNLVKEYGKSDGVKPKYLTKQNTVVDSIDPNTTVIHNIDVSNIDEVYYKVLKFGLASENYTILLGVKNNDEIVELVSRNTVGNAVTVIDTLDVKDYKFLSVCYHQDYAFEMKLLLTNKVNIKDFVDSSINYNIKNYSDKIVNRNLAISPTAILDTSKDIEYKPNTSGIFKNISNSIEVIVNGASVGLKLCEVSENELHQKDVVFRYVKSTNKWTKIVNDRLPELNQTEILPNINAGWCWFGSPFMASGGGKSFVSYLDGDSGRVKIAEINNVTKEVKVNFLSSWVDYDDHDQASILILPDGRLLVTYAMHSKENFFYSRVSTNPYDVTSWGAELKVDNLGATCYSHLFRLTNGDIINIYRINDMSGLLDWYYKVTKNNGVSWQIGGQIINDSGYIRPNQDDLNANIIHFSMTNKHPNDFNNEATNIYYFKVDLLNLKSYRANGELINKPLPLNFLDVDKLTNETIDSTWCEDLIVKGGVPRVTYVKYPNTVSNDFKEKLTCYQYFNGTEWSGEIVLTHAITGWVNTIGTNYESGYSTGSRFDENDINIIWSSIQVKGIWEMFKFDVSSGVTYEQITHNSVHDQWRPVTAKGSPFILWLNKENYPDFYHYNQQIVLFKNEK